MLPGGPEERQLTVSASLRLLRRRCIAPKLPPFPAPKCIGPLLPNQATMDDVLDLWGFGGDLGIWWGFGDLGSVHRWRGGDLGSVHR